MKRIGIIFLAILISGCVRISDLKKEEDTQLVEEPVTKVVLCSDGMESTITFYATDDDLESMQQEFYLSFEALGITGDMDVNTISQRINETLSSEYGQMSGVEVVSEMQENRVKVTIMINFKTAELSQLIDAGLLQQGEAESQYVSLEHTLSTYQNSGYACEIQ